ncbi:MAG: single-stranded-DNA-specific exonuclease RecJ [Thermosipho sp. (in: Bacteria)]|nr:single-stranded-DNA-specific exonuclease RecJ [Thermosipho sp. (in: thermotogales)]
MPKDDIAADLNPIIKIILLQKGITSPEDIKEFLSDTPKKEYDPFILDGMKEAVETVINHIARENKIVIYGDYDVDGVTGTALLLDYLSRHTDNLDYYIPVRSEGYGLNGNAVIEIKEKMGADLIITVDCGITAVEEVELAQALGMEVIITDHHEPGDQLPSCIIVNPKKKTCEYPNKNICGCGVAYKLVLAINKILGTTDTEVEELLDLVALATVADVVPLIDENRTLVKKGLKLLNNPKRLGLEVLIDRVGLNNKKINTGHIGYILGPHFNAAGRISDPKIGVELLLEKEDFEKAYAHAEFLKDCNDLRRDLQEEAEDLCAQLVEDLYYDDDFLVIDCPGISEGVIGIVAGRIRDRFYKPTLVLTDTENEGILKGSGRSIDDFDIYAFIKEEAELLERFGGHENACGFTIRNDNIEEFRRRLNDRAKKLRKENPELWVPKIDIIMELFPDDITYRLAYELEKLAPFGVGNKRPCFLMTGLEVSGYPDTAIVGKDKKHLRLGGMVNGKKIKGIAFGIADLYMEKLKKPRMIDIVFCLDINEYKGKYEVQLQIKDIKTSVLSPAVQAKEA